ncbi:uncharacterized protein AMSG_07185 [Thecamonas trahens ATCC 50062]|uniref:PH domain-containing protein n=1 Tax=Thecamonas trahens ATCC 50062 TaxID=461836 RepID=A0A0L0DFJ4_THETB|nr:hypothetical protein AMSG_07185 [Thecamonas trahens ATCC 50062]KNC50936.1 hypothetical protein AMSG_07185 [Thecamonas trahens ATCC 50062]|eukprot:XP_013756634.1 hypothetical protein AMSG_07185 [Thecamonas trahens ATCC 50062]
MSAFNKNAFFEGDDDAALDMLDALLPPPAGAAAGENAEAEAGATAPPAAGDDVVAADSQTQPEPEPESEHAANGGQGTSELSMGPSVASTEDDLEAMMRGALAGLSDDDDDGGKAAGAARAGRKPAPAPLDIAAASPASPPAQTIGGHLVLEAKAPSGYVPSPVPQPSGLLEPSVKFAPPPPLDDDDDLMLSSPVTPASSATPVLGGNKTGSAMFAPPPPLDEDDDDASTLLTSALRKKVEQRPRALSMGPPQVSGSEHAYPVVQQARAPPTAGESGPVSSDEDLDAELAAMEAEAMRAAGLEPSDGSVADAARPDDDEDVDDDDELDVTDSAVEERSKDDRIRELEAQIRELSGASPVDTLQVGAPTAAASLEGELDMLRSAKVESEEALFDQISELQQRNSQLDADNISLRDEVHELKRALREVTEERNAIDEKLSVYKDIEESHKLELDKHRKRESGAAMALQRRLSETRASSQRYEQKLKKYKRIIVQIQQDYAALDAYTSFVADKARVFIRRLGVLYARSKDAVSLAKSVYFKLDYVSFSERLPNVLGVIEQRIKNKAWKERFLVIKDNFWLAYKAKSGNPTVCIRLDTASVEIVDEPGFRNCFTIRGSDKKETMWRAQSKQELDQWLHVLSNAAKFMAMNLEGKPPVSQAFAAAAAALGSELPAAAKSGTAASPADSMGLDGLGTAASVQPTVASKPGGGRVGAAETNVANLMTISGGQAIPVSNYPYLLALDRDDGASKIVAAL